MTKTREARKSTRPAPVELHEEALDRIAGGATKAVASYYLENAWPRT